MSRRIAFVAAAAALLCGIAVTAASASSKKPARQETNHLIVGINDEADTLYANPVTAFQTLKALNTQILRVNLYWGGTQWAVANRKPTDPTDPGDPAYNWSLYDRLVQYAHTYNISLMFTILFTPSWANGGKARTVAPTNPKDLEDFAHAAAVRYSGYWVPPAWQQNSALGIGNGPLPFVGRWTAWNEPNNPIWLSPQYVRSGGKWVIESAIQYAKICNAVFDGVHSVLISPQQGYVQDEQVACGVTGPKGNDAPGSGRASVDPLSFLNAAYKAGMKDFDAYAHHPYYAAPNESPSYVPTGAQRRRIQLGNINVLINQVTKLYGPRPIWITEYGYQTNPPDKTFGVSWVTQAKWLKQAFAIARANPHITIMLWFLIKDEPSLGGWQSGLETVTGRKKPAWAAFLSVPRG